MFEHIAKLRAVCEQIQRRNDQSGSHGAEKDGGRLVTVVQQKADMISGNEPVRYVASSKLASFSRELRVAQCFARFRRNKQRCIRLRSLVREQNVT